MIPLSMSGAEQAELMIGRWTKKKEVFWAVGDDDDNDSDELSFGPFCLCPREIMFFIGLQHSFPQQTCTQYARSRRTVYSCPRSPKRERKKPLVPSDTVQWCHA